METIFISNPEKAIATGRLHDKRATEKIGQLSGRHAWLPYTYVVLPQMPEAAFLRYARSLGARSDIIVPTTLKLGEGYTMRDAFDDKSFVNLIRGRQVVSYVPDPALDELVRLHNGTYQNNPQASFGHKTRFAGLFGHVFDVPEGYVVEGKEAIAAAVYEMLRNCPMVGVRTAIGGGGIGLYQFKAQDNWTPKSILEILSDAEEPMLALVERWMNDISGAPSLYLHTEYGLIATSTQILKDGEYVGSQMPCSETVVQSSQLAELSVLLLRHLRANKYTGPAGFDLGTRAGRTRLVGFELNARYTALKVPSQIAQYIFGMPFEEWSRRGHATLSLDHFNMSEPMSFLEVYDVLDEKRLLASPGSPNGVVISIPPSGNVVGVVILSQSGHADCVKRYEQLHSLIGGNNEFDPLFVE